MFVCRLRGGGEGHVMENKSVQVCVCGCILNDCVRRQDCYLYESLCVFSVVFYVTVY